MVNDKRYRIFFLIPPDVHLLDASGPIHVFYEAKEYGAPLNLKFLKLTENKQQRSSAGIFFAQLENYDDYSLTDSDILFIPGLNADLLFDEPFQQSIKPFYQWLSAQYKKGTTICSVCTGAYLLAYSGLLSQKECTTHWKYLEDFKNRFPEVELLPDRLFVKDDRLYSSAGVSSGIDLALYLLEELYGPIFATQIAKEIVVYLRRGENDPQLSVFLQYRNHLENRIHKVQDLLAQKLDSKQKIEALADKVNMSPRNLTRLFKKITGLTIGDYHDKLRVERAHQLLSKGEKVEVVSAACGLSSNQLRSLLRKDDNNSLSQMS